MVLAPSSSAGGRTAALSFLDRLVTYSPVPATSLDLVLVRHGLTDWNEQGRLLGRTHVELNVRGRAQADAVAQALHNLPLRAVWSSPLRRAQETAEPIAQAHGLCVETETGLDEVWLGRWVGKTFGEIQDDPDLRRCLDDPLYTCDAIEPAVSVEQRVVDVVERLRADAADKAVALVSHGDPLRILVSHYLHMHLPDYRRLVIGNGSVSLLRFSPYGCRLLALNWLPGGPAQVASNPAIV